jgi:outer membrane lipoprotein LolB
MHEVRLKTMTGGRQWLLRFGPASAALQGSDVGVLRGPDPEPLVEAAVGWPIPVGELAWWIRGLVPPARDSAIRFATDGTLAAASSPPWEIAFERFDDETGQLLPARIEARSADYRVRLVLRGWNLGSQSESNSL